jgi:hypothetical protein
MADQSDYLRNLHARLLADPAKNAWGRANQQMADPQIADFVRTGVHMSEGGVTPVPAGTVANKVVAPLLGRAISSAARYGLNALNPSATATPVSGRAVSAPPAIVPNARSHIDDAIAQLQPTQAGP